MKTEFTTLPEPSVLQKQQKRAFALFIDSPREGRQPVRDESGEVRVFRSERKAQEAIARIGLRKLWAFLRGEIDFDDALTVEEYYLEARTALGGLVGIQGKR